MTEDPFSTEVLTEYLLKQPIEKKVQLLEDAYDESIGTFLGIADIFLKAPCGEGGGLPTEFIDDIFQKKQNQNKDE